MVENCIDGWHILILLGGPIGWREHFLFVFEHVVVIFIVIGDFGSLASRETNFALTWRKVSGRLQVAALVELLVSIGSRAGRIGSVQGRA